jgi:Holliday junction DNA helicase RuvA
MDEDFVPMVMDVLISQLGYKTNDARQLITEALKRNSGISTAEDLFDEIYRWQRK